MISEAAAVSRAAVLLQLVSLVLYTATIITCNGFFYAYTWKLDVLTRLLCFAGANATFLMSALLTRRPKDVAHTFWNSPKTFLSLLLGSMVFIYYRNAYRSSAWWPNVAVLLQVHAWCRLVRPKEYARAQHAFTFMWEVFYHSLWGQIRDDFFVKGSHTYDRARDPGHGEHDSKYDQKEYAESRED